jgi:hypothetical protein
MFDDVPLAWADVAARFATEPCWWIGTTGSSGPHAVPIWGVVVDDVLYFYGEPDTLRSRHIVADNRIVLHLPDPMDVLVVKGKATPTGRSTARTMTDGGSRTLPAWRTRSCSRSSRDGPSPSDQPMPTCGAGGCGSRPTRRGGAPDVRIVTKGTSPACRAGST